MGLSKSDYIKVHGEEAWEIESQRRKDYQAKYRKEHKEKIKERQRQYYVNNIDSINAQKKEYNKRNKEHLQKKRKEYYEENKERILSDRKKYRESNKEKVYATNKKWREENSEYINEKNKQYYLDNKERLLEYRKCNYDSTKQKEWWSQYSRTKDGRANHHISHYSYEDRKRNRGECTLSKGWIIEHIFNSKCIYCGDSDWTHLGCDRINNDLPHTQENCVCSCGICNVERQLKKMSVEEFIDYRKTHPRDAEPIKLQEIVEINGIKVIRKKAV